MMVLIAEPVGIINKRLGELTMSLSNAGGDIKERSQAINEVTRLCYERKRLREGLGKGESISPRHFISLSPT